MRAKLQLGVGAALLVAMGGFCAARLQVSTDVTHFLASAGPMELVRISRQLAQSDLNRSMVLSLKGSSPEAALLAGEQIRAALKDHPQVAWIENGPAAGLEQAYHELYFSRRFQFLSERPDVELPGALSDEGLRRAARELKRQLSLPMGTLIKKQAPADPLLAFAGQLRRLRRIQGALQLEEGRFRSEDGEAIVFLASRRSAFDTEAQRELISALDGAFAAAKAAAGGTLRMERAGVNLVALASERSIKADVQRISIVSTLGIVLLFLLLFRSPRFVLLGLLPLGVGVLTALSLTLALFGSVHGITLAFGAALIGVCIDYPVHLFNHHVLDPDVEGAEGSLRRIWGGLVLGALTTVAGFAGLLGSGFPGMREIAAFGLVGVLAALLATRYLVTPLLPAAPRGGPLQRRAADALRRLQEGAARHRGWMTVLPLGALVVCGLGLPELKWLDDPKGLYAEDPSLAAERDRVRGRVSRMDGARFVIALGPDVETALQRNDQVYQRLLAAEREAALLGFQSLHTFLWSAELQRKNLAQVRGAPRLAERTLAALSREEFVAAAFQPYRAALQELADEPPAPLTLEDLLASPLAQAVRPFVVRLADGQVAVLTFLRGVTEGEGLGQRLDDLEGVHYLDQNAFLSRVYGSYRGQLLRLVGLGLLAVLALLAWRYRRLRATLAAFLPALLAALTTLAVMALAGFPIHLLHVAALLLVLSMGADYGIFLAESRAHPAGLSATLLSVAIACATTILAFGLLGLSSAPVLRAIGLTCGLGVSLALVLAPAALVLAGDGAP